MINIDDGGRYDMRNMYSHFIETAEEDYNLVSQKIVRYKSLLYKVKYSIEQNRNAVEAIFDVCVYNYWEWNTDELDITQKMENAIDAKYVRFNTIKQLNYGNLYRTLKQYFRVLRRIHECELKLERTKKRKLITSDQYKEYCKLFFGEVSRQVLRGKIYKFEKKIGSLIIERIKSGKSHVTADGKVIVHKHHIDYQKTELNKRKLLIQGLTPYNREEHIKALQRGEKYEGIKYVELSDKEFYCRVIMIDGAVKNRTMFKFHGKNTHMTVSNAALLAKCNSVEDIINLDTDINNRLSLIREFDSSYTIKYIRNNEQRTIFRRNYYSKTGQ